MKLQIYRLQLYQKKRFRHRCFLVNSAKFLITLFLKNPLHGCFCINNRSIYCPTIPFFQKRCHTYFLPESFVGLIYRPGTIVNSIFQALSQMPIFIPVEHLRRSFFLENSQQIKAVQYIRKKSCLVDVRPGSDVLVTSVSSH